VLKNRKQRFRVERNKSSWGGQRRGTKISDEKVNEEEDGRGNQRVRAKPSEKSKIT